MQTTAFVAGATGYTGRHVVDALRERGVPTIAHVRPDSPRRDEWIHRFRAAGARTDTTPWHEDALAGSLASLQPTLVFALIGTTRQRGREDARASYETVDYGLTHALLTAAARLSPPPLFVYLSSIGARANTRSAYLAARGRIEAELHDSGMPSLIARPAFISGPDRDEPRPAERLGARILDAALMAAGRLGARSLYAAYGSLTGRELGAGLVRLALEGRRGVVGPTELRG